MNSPDIIATSYTVMKNHGSIEARGSECAFSPMPRYTVMKNHGSIEASGSGASPQGLARYTVMKNHGSIEAIPFRGVLFSRIVTP